MSRPALFDWLPGSTRVTMVSAPPGSGKTMLLRPWIAAGERVAWVPVGRDHHDPRHLWLSVLDALATVASPDA